MGKSRQTLLNYALLLLGAILIVHQSARLVQDNKLKIVEKKGQARIALYAKSLQDSLEKYRPIPYLLSRDTRIKDLLLKKVLPIKVNPHLEDFAHAGQTLIYVLDQQGTTVAASNWRSPQSLMGHNFAFRPYFKEARENRPGSYYAIGLRTGLPGFFISYPVLQEGKLLGVVVVKVNLEQLQQTWRDSGETIIVSDAYGILFLSSHPDWKYRSLRPLSEKTTKLLQKIQYPGQPLNSLQASRVTRKTGEVANILKIDSVSFLEQSQQLVDYGWRIHYLSNMAPVKNSFNTALLLGSGVTLSVFLTSLYVRERRQRHRIRREAKEAKAIKKLNELLTIEIEQHRKTEKHLKKTQEELIQTGKLAALGRMSAAVVHELNQPVTAIRTFLASSKILIERNRVVELKENLAMMNSLTDRMMAVTGQLKTFARKDNTSKDYVVLQDVLEKVLSFSASQLREQNIVVKTTLAKSDTYVVKGSSLQLEQVLSNLILNAMDAMDAGVTRAIQQYPGSSLITNEPKKQLSLHLEKKENFAVLTVQDTGPGIAKEALDSLFEPFYTTKEIGKGLGLGLSISYGIINQMGGTITAENPDEGGALFTLRLPLASPPEDSME